jgi:hypothetical protein
MNGFASQQLDEDAFAEKPGLKGGLRTFDAFRMPAIALVFLPNLSQHADRANQLKPSGRTPRRPAAAGNGPS